MIDTQNINKVCLLCVLYVIVKALPRVCMKNTARGECRVVNTARGECRVVNTARGECRVVNTARGEAECCIHHETPPSAVFHTHKHRHCFKWYIVLDHSQLMHVVVTAPKRTTS